MMERQKIITIVSILVIFGTVTFSFLNIYALEKLELSGIDNNFRFFVMSTDDKIKICNDSLLPANFNQFNIIIFYEDDVLGTFIVDSASITLGSFLSVVGAMTYLEYRINRLLFVMFAFAAITTAEIVSTANFLLFFQESYINMDSLLTHGLILLMLSLFSLGIFRTD